MYYESYLTVQNIEESIIDLKHEIVKWNLQYKKWDLHFYFISFEIFKRNSL